MTNHKIDIDFINKIYDDELRENVKLKATLQSKIASINDIIDILKMQAMQHMKSACEQIKKDFDSGEIDGETMVNRLITVGQKCDALDKIIKLKEKKVKTLKEKTKFVLE